VRHLQPIHTYEMRTIYEGHEKSFCLCRRRFTMHLFHRERQKFPYFLPLRMHVGLFVLQLSTFMQSATVSILYSCLGFGTIYNMFTFCPIFLAKTLCFLLSHVYVVSCIMAILFRHVHFSPLKATFLLTVYLFLLYEHNRKTISGFVDFLALTTQTKTITTTFPGLCTKYRNVFGSADKS